MKELSRRNFLRLCAAGLVGAAAGTNFPFLGRRLALAGAASNFFTIAVIMAIQGLFADFHSSLLLPAPQKLLRHITVRNKAGKFAPAPVRIKLNLFLPIHEALRAVFRTTLMILECEFS
jgi:hypothetical protein